ncbi:rod shape-determining protein MreC [Parelusimicrobium proximum]
MYHSDDNRFSKRISFFYLGLSLLLVVLPLRTVVNSIKSVLAYVFIPQVRMSHATVEYFQGANETVKELINAHAENVLLQNEISAARILQTQMEEVMRENERLSAAVKIAPHKKWEGTWAKVAYRESNRWNTVIIDKGSKDGVENKSAVVAIENGVLALAGEVIEVNESTAKILLVNDMDFSAYAHLALSGNEGLITGTNGRFLKLKYLPLDIVFEEDEEVLTSPNSSVFPRGIRVGKARRQAQVESTHTSATFNVAPFINPNSVKEVFVIKQGAK